MRFTISREQLISGLAAVTPSTPGKTTLPVLGNLLLESSARGIRLSGTDLDIFVRKEIAADVEGGGSMTVPAKRLLSIAKELPPAPVRISMSEGTVKLDCGRSSYVLHTLPNDDFPAFPALDFGSSGSFTLKAGDLQSLAKRTDFAVSTEESRPIMQGVLVEIVGDRLRFVAMNGHRFALADQRIEAPEPVDLSLIVPTRALDHIGRLFDAEDQLDVVRTENYLGFRSPSTEVYTRLIEGPYPSYKTVIPKKHARTMRVDRLALISSLRRMVPVASDKVHRIRLVFAPGKLRLSASTPDIGKGNDEVVAELLTGETITISTNATYLLEALAHLDGDQVDIKTDGVDRAMVIEPSIQREDSYALYLVMPMRTLED